MKTTKYTPPGPPRIVTVSKMQMELGKPFIATVSAPADEFEEIFMSGDQDEIEWRELYAQHMKDCGVEPSFADQAAAAAEYDVSTEPEEAADAEMSYWQDDGDEA